jgi:hypothetical protein
MDFVEEKACDFISWLLLQGILCGDTHDDMIRSSGRQVVYCSATLEFEPHARCALEPRAKSNLEDLVTLFQRICSL